MLGNAAVRFAMEGKGVVKDGGEDGGAIHIAMCVTIDLSTRPQKYTWRQISRDHICRTRETQLGRPAHQEVQSKPESSGVQLLWGSRIYNIKNQVEHQFLEHAGKKPDWAPWSAGYMLFGGFSLAFAVFL